MLRLKIFKGVKKYIHILGLRPSVFINYCCLLIDGENLFLIGRV